MSVHGEYSRALETLIVAVRALEAADREPWLQRFTEARVDRQPDLSAAARQSVEVIRDLETTQSAPRIVDLCANLLAHCQMILGSLD